MKIKTFSKTNMLKLFFILCLYFLGFFFVDCVQSYPSNHSTSIENFRLLDQYGKSHELFYYSDMKAVVLFWQGNGCPIVRQSLPTLEILRQKYEKKGVVFLMINANLQDDRFSIAKEAEAYGTTIPILEDSAQVVSSALGIKRTATCMVIDPKNGSILYQGPIDDRLGYETQKSEATQHYLEDAIKALLRGKYPPVSSLQVKGCLIYLEEKTNPQNYTYTEHVAPILRKKCLQCHSKGGVAPWSMDNYKMVKGWSSMIREVIRTKRMPPFQPDPYYGEFAHDNSLTNKEIRTIVNWTLQETPRGDGEDPLEKAPKPNHSNWPLGKPDLVVSFNEEQNLPASGVLGYRYIMSDYIAERDIWLKGSHLRPNNLKTVHHAIAFAAPPEKMKEAILSVQERRVDEKIVSLIGGYSPGKAPAYFPEGLGRLLPKGSQIFFEFHYITTGKPEKDLTKLALYFHPSKPPKKSRLKTIALTDFSIPPYVKNKEIVTNQIIEQDIMLYSLKPHMHYRGKSMRIIAQYPDGISEILLSVPNYYFHWQHRYLFKKPKIIPAKTKIIVHCSFDNSAQNPYNPDPSKTVTHGSQSTDEMIQALFVYTKMDDDS